MGGWGSGRYNYATTPTVAECRSMDMDDLKEKRPGETGVIWWGDREDPDAKIAYKAEGERTLDDDTRAAAVRFKYTITKPRTDESRTVEFVAGLDYTECHFGGFRPWFRCPECRDRRRKLYLPRREGGDGRFLCRECYDLGYQSSRTSGNALERAEQRYRKAFAKADAENRRPHPNGEPWLPDRPKGMHYDTFDDLLEDVRAASREYERATMEQLRTLAKRSSVDVPAWALEDNKEITQ